MQIEIWQAIQHLLENHKFHFGHKPSHGESMSCENLSDDLQCCWANILTNPGVADIRCFSYRDSPKIEQANAKCQKKTTKWCFLNTHSYFQQPTNSSEVDIIFPCWLSWSWGFWKIRKLGPNPTSRAASCRFRICEDISCFFRLVEVTQKTSTTIWVQFHRPFFSTDFCFITLILDTKKTSLFKKKNP